MDRGSTPLTSTTINPSIHKQRRLIATCDETRSQLNYCLDTLAGAVLIRYVTSTNLSLAINVIIFTAAFILTRLSDKKTDGVFFRNAAIISAVMLLCSLTVALTVYAQCGISVLGWEIGCCIGLFVVSAVFSMIEHRASEQK